MKRRAIFLKAVLGGLLILSVGAMGLACGGDDDGENENELTVEFDYPTITIDPIRYDFSADVGPGDEEEGELTFTNIGAQPLEISEVRINPLGDDVFFPGAQFPSAGVTLESLESHTFSVWYRPQDGDEHSSAINLDTNDPERSSATIPLAAPAYQE